ncbi:GNAT family N-acetyltransferase [Cellulomonas sp. RIT-PI-Y]|uniref:GNAT family N-acetyltransferase n=1 Tax=Cellulomonas sp. RIT-PI-Y TaxID=3035297 RepID=UPI0021D7E5CC|nr:GNAT family N-acetyltransferase [Cellulomonas sp. RIT-PI-Y]
MRLRPATAADRPLLLACTVEAVNWTGEDRADPTDPLLTTYVTDFPDRPGDAGIVAEDDDGPLGAAWLRLLPGGWGHVADDVPELSLAVLPRGRGRGVGSALLAGILADPPRVSLSVEDGNDRARGMYERAGFTVVGRVGGSDTMLRVRDDSPGGTMPR